MKLLTIIFLLLPFALYAQTDDEAKQEETYRNEIGFNNGFSVLPTADITQIHPAFGLRYFHNYRNAQIGIALSGNRFYNNIEFGQDFKQSVSVSPELIVNRTFRAYKHYSYIGAAAGYYLGHSGRPEWKMAQ